MGLLSILIWLAVVIAVIWGIVTIIHGAVISGLITIVIALVIGYVANAWPLNSLY